MDAYRLPLTAYRKSRWIWSSLLLVGALMLGACGGGSEAVIETVSPDVASEAITDNPEAIVLDIRTAQEFSEGIIEGAVNIDFYATDFAAQLDGLDKDTQYVVYCRSGNRSGQSMSTFEELGFTHITEVDGGIVNWYNTGHPVVAP